MTNFLSSLYIVEIRPLSDVGIVKILLHPVCCHFVMLTMSFALQKIFRPHLNTWAPEKASSLWQHSPESWHFKIAQFFSAAAESGKPLLKELLLATSKQQEAIKLCIVVSRIRFQVLLGFK